MNIKDILEDVKQLKKTVKDQDKKIRQYEERLSALESSNPEDADK